MGCNTKTWTGLASFSLLSHHLQWKESKYQYYGTVVCPRMKGQYFTQSRGAISAVVKAPPGIWAVWTHTAWTNVCPTTQSTQLSCGVLWVALLKKRRSVASLFFRFWLVLFFRLLTAQDRGFIFTNICAALPWPPQQPLLPLQSKQVASQTANPLCDGHRGPWPPAVTTAHEARREM